MAHGGKPISLAQSEHLCCSCVVSGKMISQSLWWCWPTAPLQGEGGEEQKGLWVPPLAVSLLSFGTKSLKKSTEGLMQIKAKELLSSLSVSLCLSIHPLLHSPERFDSGSRKSEPEIGKNNSLTGIIYPAREEEEAEGLQFLPVQSIQPHWG